MRSHLRIPYDAIDACRSGEEELYCMQLWQRIDRDRRKRVRVQYRAESERLPGLTYATVRRLVKSWCDAGLMAREQDGRWLVLTLTVDGACARIAKTGLKQGQNRVETGSTPEETTISPRSKQGQNRVETGSKQPPLGVQPSSACIQGKVSDLADPPSTEQQPVPDEPPAQPTLPGTQPSPDEPKHTKASVWREAAQVYSEVVRPAQGQRRHQLQSGVGMGHELGKLIGQAAGSRNDYRLARERVLRLWAWWAYSRHPRARWLRNEAGADGRQWGRCADVSTLRSKWRQYLGLADDPDQPGALPDDLDLDAPETWGKTKAAGPPQMTQAEREAQANEDARRRIARLMAEEGNP